MLQDASPKEKVNCLAYLLMRLDGEYPQTANTVCRCLMHHRGPLQSLNSTMRGKIADLAQRYKQEEHAKSVSQVYRPAAVQQVAA